MGLRWETQAPPWDRPNHWASQLHTTPPPRPSIWDTWCLMCGVLCFYLETHIEQVSCLRFDFSFPPIWDTHTQCPRYPSAVKADYHHLSLFFLYNSLIHYSWREKVLQPEQSALVVPGSVLGLGLPNSRLLPRPWDILQPRPPRGVWNLTTFRIRSLSWEGQVDDQMDLLVSDYIIWTTETWNWSFITRDEVIMVSRGNAHPALAPV